MVNRQRVTETPKQPQVTATSKTAKPKKPEPKPTPAPKPANIKPKTKAAASVKTVADKPTAYLVVSTQPTTSPLEDIADLDNLLLQTCVKLTLRLLSSISSLLKGAALQRALLKTVILFMGEYGSAP